MCRGSEADAASRNARVEFGVGQQPLESAILLLEILQPLGQSLSGGHRTASSFHEYVCSVTPIFLTAIGNGLASPHLDFDSRSLWMASSFFPRGMECPPLVVTPPDYLSGSGAVEGGQVRPLSLLSLPSALEREQGSRFVLRVRCELWHD